MKMQDERQALEKQTAAANEQLVNLGLKDTVDSFLNTQNAREIIDVDYTGWVKGLRVFASKMPEVAKSATDSLLKDIEEAREDFVKFVYMSFKTSLIGALKELETYVSLENLLVEMKSNPARELMWGVKLCDRSNQLLEEISSEVRVDIAEVTFYALESDEEVERFSDILGAEPDGEVLMIKLSRRLAAQEAQTIMAEGLMGMFFDAMSDTEDEDE